MNTVDKTGAERRIQRRFDSPVMYAEIDGELFEAHNWSFGGCMLSSYKGSLFTGALFSITGIGPSKNELVPVELKARVVRRSDDTGELAVAFDDMNRSGYKTLLEMHDQT